MSRPEIPFRRVCLVAGVPAVEAALQSFGCEVQVFHPGGGAVFDVQEALAQAGFVPDLLIQREQLSGPNILTGLEGLSCPKIFWSLDTHLGLWWQKHYATLFDGVMTTQSHLESEFQEIPGWNGATGCLPWAGFEREWVPFAERSTGIGFVGRVTPDRPVRIRLVELLRSRYGAECVEGMNFVEMCDFYANTRIAPNESIFGEVNFRLFETASCGCLPVLQDIGYPLDHLLVPGKEAEVYSNAAELVDILTFYNSRPESAEALGKAARERVLREHLFIHRARTLLDFAAGIQAGGKQAALRGAAADKARTLAAHALWLGGRVPFPPGALEMELHGLGQDPDSIAPLLALFAAVGQTDKSRQLVTGVVNHWNAAALGEAAVMPALAVSMTGLKFGNFSLAVKMYLDLVGGLGAASVPPPKTPAALLKAWARILRSRGRVFRSGFRFDPARHLPATAEECLAAAVKADPEDLEAFRMLDSCLSGVRGAEHLRVGFLSNLSLHEPDNWRVGLHLGLLNLGVFRRDEGLADIRAAKEAAAAAGKEGAFQRMLGAADPRNAVRNQADI